MPSSTSSESSFMLWALGLAIVMLTAHVLIGWLREAQVAERWPRRLVAMLVVGAIFGLGWNLALALGLLGESLAFPLGFQRWWVVGLWLAGTGASVLALGWLGTRVTLFSTAGCGVLLAVVVTALQAGWIMAAGFRPGVVWRQELLAVAFVVQAVGFATALTLAFPGTEKHRGRVSWRLAAAAMMAFVGIAGHALVILSARLTVQVGSLYRSDVSASMLALAGGAIVPFALILLAVDLELRRRARRHQRRHRVRRRAQILPAAPGPGPAAPAGAAGDNPAP